MLSYEIAEDGTCNDDDSNDTDELLRTMLGGISFDGEWIEEVDNEPGSSPRVVPGRVPVHEFYRDPSSPSTSKLEKIDYALSLEQTVTSSDSSSATFEYSYRCTGDSPFDVRLESPPVRIVDLGPRRGNGLVVTSPIPRGSVVYTERAAAATQVPPVHVQACQYCFRSLESITALSDRLPCPDLWPIPLLQVQDTMKDVNGNLQLDVFGRVRCGSCQSLYCSKQHYETFCKEYASCCQVASIQEAVVAMSEGHTVAVQAAVALGARLFAQVVQYFRLNKERIEGHFLDGFCGTASDLSGLELGEQDSTGQYTLQPLYGSIASILELTSMEQKTLSLELFHTIAAQAARNGFGLLTQSPFKVYYAALLRKSTSRDSEEHRENMRLVAQALVGQDSLQRGMDRDIEAKVAPEICAVFPLTARCNHSCEPNAQVRSQEFVDFHIDVVALRDLAVGDELLISYIPVGAGVGKRSTVQRRRELQAKYLFCCECPMCSCITGSTR